MIIRRIFAALSAMALASALPVFTGTIAAAVSLPEAETHCVLAADTGSSLAYSDLAVRTGSEYGYRDMEYRSNTDGRRLLYEDLMIVMERFWENDQDAEKLSNIIVGDFYFITILILETYELSFDEAAEVYETFRNDNPLFYFASNELMAFPVSDNTTYLMINCYDEFAQGSVRQAYQEALPDFIEGFSPCVKGESDYADARALHDKLIESMDYAYEEDGATPLKSGITGSIIGAMEGYGICDAYSKTYQLLCNYYGIENVYVTGRVKEGHSWNAVMLDDGNYYFVDCTGDDAGDVADDRYFAVGSDTLEKTHQINTPENEDAEFLYALPEISKTDYQPSGDAPEEAPLGDVNDDGAFDLLDVILMQKWILAVDGTELVNWQNGDLNEDGSMDVLDLVLMKRALLTKQGSSL